MKISSHKLTNPVIIPSSKSYAARMIILAALSEQVCTVTDIPSSSDTLELIDVLVKLEIGYWEEDCFIINRSFPKDEKKSEQVITLNVGEGGTTIRFLLTMLSMGKNSYLFKVHPRFKSRPFEEQLELLKKLGAEISFREMEDELCLIKGPIGLPENLDIDCSKTTQVASSFILISHFYDLKVTPNYLQSSNAYIDMTKFVNSSFSLNMSVPVDMSSAASFIGLAAVFQNLEFPQIFRVDPYQADAQVISLLESCGCDIEFAPHLKVKKSELKAFDVDGSKFLDLVPTLCFIAAHARGESVIRNIQNLAHKESNRLDGICKILDQVKVKYSVTDESIKIRGGMTLKSLEKIEAFADHRMVMLASLFLKVLGGGEVSDSETVSKSNSKFFELLN